MRRTADRLDPPPAPSSVRITINGVPADTGSWVGNSFDWLTGRAESLSMPVVAPDPALRDERPSMGMTLRRVK